MCLACLSPSSGIAWLLAFSTNNLTDGNLKFACKLEVTLIMGRYTHNCARAIAHQDVIGDPDRNIFPTDRVNHIATSEDTTLLLLGAHTFNLGHTPCLFDIGIDLGSLLWCCDLLDPG